MLQVGPQSACHTGTDLQPIAVDTPVGSTKKGNWWTSIVNTFKSVKQETARRQVELVTRRTVSQAADVLIAYGGKITKLGKDVVRAKFGGENSKFYIA